jgi:hypothetical protein
MVAAPDYGQESGRGSVDDLGSGADDIGTE